MFQKMLGGLVCLALVAVSNLAWGQGVATLNGQWHVTRGTMNGETVPDDVLASMQLKVNNTGDFNAESGGLISNGKFATGGAADQLTVTINGGADSGRNLKAKWRMENGQLTIAFSQADFPKDFNSTAGSNLVVLSYAAGPRPATSVSSNSTPTNRPAAGSAGPAVKNSSGGNQNTMSVTQ